MTKIVLSDLSLDIAKEAVHEYSIDIILISILMNGISVCGVFTCML